MPECLIAPLTEALPIHALFVEDFDNWLESQDQRAKTWVSDIGFSPKPGQTLVLPGVDGKIHAVVYCIGNEEGQGGPWAWAGLYAGLPPSGRYKITSDHKADVVNDAALGFALASYRYRFYRHSQTADEAAYNGPFLVWPDGVDKGYVQSSYGATKLARDLINTPASDMGPRELAKAAQDLAEASGAKCKTIVGVDLIREGFPAIYAVGRGAEDNRAPRLVDFNWGPPNAPKVTLIGKGVCFDTGGLDIKSTAGMKLMKKDMGGAANVLALASLVMAAKLAVRLRVLIPAVENAVSEKAMRPLDVVSTRQGLSLEIGNTDAEGRVVLADALALASEESPDLILDFATLTGAARVALGTDLPALFCNDNELAGELLKASEHTADPLWRMPLWQPYKAQTKSKIADLRNDTDGPYGGAIMAALFLEHFVKKDLKWAHIDLMAWNLRSRPGRPEGGEALGIRAVFDLLKNRFGT